MYKNLSINDADQMEEQLPHLYEKQCKIMVKDNLPENIDNNPATDQSTTFERSSKHPFIGVSNIVKMGFEQMNEYLMIGDKDSASQKCEEIVSAYGIVIQSVIDKSNGHMDSIEQLRAIIHNIGHDISGSISEPLIQFLYNTQLYPSLEELRDTFSQWLEELDVKHNKIIFKRVKKASKCLEELSAHIETKKDMVDDRITNNADEIKTRELLAKLTEIMLPLFTTKIIESHTF